MSALWKDFKDLNGNTIRVGLSTKKKEAKNKVEIWVFKKYLYHHLVELTGEKAREIAEEIIRLANEIEGVK